jgi:hypothetical protein
MRFRFGRLFGTAEGYDREIINSDGDRVATVHCGFNPSPVYALEMADAPEAVEACRLLTELLGLHPEVNRILQSQDDKGWWRAIELAAQVARSQGVSLGRQEF